MSVMSIATRTGDDGTTGLMYNRRLPKNHPRVEAYGAVDELKDRFTNYVEALTKSKAKAKVRIVLEDLTEKP